MYLQIQAAVSQMPVGTCSVEMVVMQNQTIVVSILGQANIVVKVVVLVQNILNVIAGTRYPRTALKTFNLNSYRKKYRHIFKYEKNFL